MKLNIKHEEAYSSLNNLEQLRILTQKEVIDLRK